MFSNRSRLFCRLTKKNLARGQMRYLTEKEVNCSVWEFSINFDAKPEVIVGLARYFHDMKH
jgi:hypothetical protein